MTEELRQRYNKREQELAVAQARNEQAESDLKNLMAEAEKLYGVKSVEEAQEKLSALVKKIKELTDDLDKALDEVGA